MKWKNLKGTGERIPDGYISWIDYWEKKANKSGKDCKVMKCGHSASVGGHVKRVGSVDGSWYIVPLCYSHNKTEDEFELNADASPIPVRE